MRAGAKLCALLVLALVTVAAGKNEEKKRPLCPEGQKACQIGENTYVCVDIDDNCPDPEDAARRAKKRGSICPDDLKACQVGEDEYVCVHPDAECP